MLEVSARAEKPTAAARRPELSKVGTLLQVQSWRDTVGWCPGARVLGGGPLWGWEPLKLAKMLLRQKGKGYPVLSLFPL